MLATFSRKGRREGLPPAFYINAASSSSGCSTIIM
jgi:hypothetical protein